MAIPSSENKMLAADGRWPFFILLASKITTRLCCTVNLVTKMCIELNFVDSGS
jgi:hypothetical protein